MRRTTTAFFAATILLFSSTYCTKKQKSENQPRANKASLSLEHAEIRKSLLSDINYLFEIDLRTSKVSSSYEGVSTIMFNMSDDMPKSGNLSVDFEGGSVLEVYANGKRLSDFTHNGFFIDIPFKYLKKQKNSLKIKFNQNFSKTGSGLYKFKDTEDDRVYLYTDFEPYDANLFAPLFDQPNLKAHYSLNVKTPIDWTVVTSVLEQYAQTENNYILWSFPKSQKYSTYIFSLHAGPYKIWNDTAKLKSKEIPMRLMARQSLAKYVKPEFWFKSTKQGFNFFEQYFNIEYPYTKYDQVIVPDFNSGAMENVAAVTFSERFVVREETPTRANRRSLSNVIFHEMAHMWFGNLVTMDWWNDLWLNESFATFMAYTGLYYNTEYTDSWVNFFNRTKKWAYSEDRWRTTHPIEGSVNSTEEAMSSFDGITYGKGASSLKQLVFLIGEDAFKKGLTDYFKEYAEKNTIRKNFIDSLQAHTKEDLNSWTKEWLQTAGLNTIKSDFSCKDGKLQAITFDQGVASGENINRTHKLSVALWTEDQFRAKPSVELEARISGPKTLLKPEGEIDCPKAVFPNWDDYGFAQFTIDDVSFSYFSENINRFESELFRSQFWYVLNVMLEFGEIAPEKVFPVVLNQLPKEKNTDVLGAILGLSYIQNPLFYYYTNQEKAKSDRKALAQLLKNLIVKEDVLDNKKLLFDEWSLLAYQDQTDELVKCLKKCSFDLGFELDIDKKWNLLKRLAAVRHPKTSSFLNQLYKEDSSREGSVNKLAVETLMSQNKELLLNKALNNDSKMSLRERLVMIWYMVPYPQRDEYFAFVQKSFFENIDKIKDVPPRLQRSFASVFAPLFCGDYQKNIPITEEQVKGSEWNFGVKKALLQTLDVEERCLKIKEASKKYNAKK